MFSQRGRLPAKHRLPLMCVAELPDACKHWRMRLWLRVAASGPATRPAKLGYADGSGPLRVAQRLESAAAAGDAKLQKELDRTREQVRMSIVKSRPP